MNSVSALESIKTEIVMGPSGKFKIMVLLSENPFGQKGPA